jgi:putative ABC transport system ATP-binding protein
VSPASSSPAAEGGWPAIEIRGATKRFAGLGRKETMTALDGLDLTVARGSYVALIGSNGAGKSTLLSLLAGTLLADEGTILVDGEDITDEPSWQRARDIALVRQNPEHNVLSGLTIEQNFALAMLGRTRAFKLSRYDRDEVRSAAAAALGRFGMGLEDRLGESTATLSGGQRQAVAVAMAAVRRPKVLLLDEHVSALDPKRARVVGEVTEEIVRDQTITALMVTHDLARATASTDRILMMHRGKVVMDLEGGDKATMSVAMLASRFEEIVGEALPDRTLLAAS